MRRTTIIFAAVLAFSLSAVSGAADGKAAATDPPPGFDAARHMRVGAVRPGMRGYGMSVFHGVDPEPFAVEVVSVQHGFSPGKSVVWVRCPDERMQLTGPVRGMSGSPIYLWEPGVDAKLGEGGKLLGAFAFGHSLGKDCYVGVQPIEHMLATASRAQIEDADGDKGAAAPDAGAGVRVAMLDASFRLADAGRLDEHATWRLRAMAHLAGFTREPAGAAERRDEPWAHTPMALPVMVGSTRLADALTPYFAAAGLQPVAAGAKPAGTITPHWIDAEKVTIRPGGVFAIPMVLGPLDLAAIGTTTEVLPDGTALAFGHAFFNQGPIRVPMAPGYVHFIQPNLQASFKLGGSLGITGAVIRDESAAVVGKPGLDFPTAPVNVRLSWPDKGLDRTFAYRVVHHDRLAPALIGAVLAMSVDTDVDLPRLNTLTIDTTIEFSNDRRLSYTSVAPRAQAVQIAMAVVPAVSTLTDTPFGAVRVRSVDAHVRISPEVREARIIGVSLRQTPVKPGDTLTAVVRLKPYRGEAFLKTLQIDVPKDAADGQYALSIGGASMQSALRQQTHPHRFQASSERELFDAAAEQLTLRDDALYATLQLQRADNLAIGRTELPELPSSRIAMLNVAGSTRTTRYPGAVEREFELDYVVVDQVQVTVQVVSEDAAR